MDKQKGCVVQEVECSPSKHKALSSNPIMQKVQNKIKKQKIELIRSEKLGYIPKVNLELRLFKT
jgi:hypothetical protein